MTAKQKANQARFKKVVAEAKNLRKKNPKLTQAQAVKQAWAKFTGKKVGSTKTHKDTKSHNVNIRVVSGNLGALPIDFKGSFLGYKFSIVNQYTIDGGVSLFFLDKDRIKILELNGRKDEEKRAIDILSSRAIANFGVENGYQLDVRDQSELKKRVEKFVKQINSEVKDYNSGKDRNVKKAKPVKIQYKPSTKKLSVVDEIKTILKENKKILKGGYVTKPGKVRIKGVNKFDRIINQGINEFYVDKLKTLTDALAKAEKSKAIFDADWKTKDKQYKIVNAAYKKHWPTRIKFLKKMISETKRHIK